jgi:hypothetical protein
VAPECRRRAAWTPSFVYEHADTETWQKTLVEQEKSGVAMDWMREPLREPTHNFFDERRLRELSTAGSATHRPTTSSAASRPPWSQMDRGITPRSRPSTSGNVWFSDGAEQDASDLRQPQRQQPVQLLPRYMVIREMRRENKIAQLARTPRAVVTPRHKPVGERPVDIYSALGHPKHIPSLDLARVGLKSAPTGARSELSARTPHKVDTLRPVTQGSSRRPIVPKLPVPAIRTDHERQASAAPTERRATLTARDLSALPEPLQQALILQASRESGNVSAHRGND